MFSYTPWRTDLQTSLSYQVKAKLRKHCEVKDREITADKIDDHLASTENHKANGFRWQNTYISLQLGVLRGKVDEAEGNKIQISLSECTRAKLACFVHP